MDTPRAIHNERYSEGMSEAPSPDIRPLGSKGPGHDQRRCRFLVPNPALDRGTLPEGVDRTRLPLFLCLVKGRPLLTTMRKCRFCRETNLWYQPRDDSPDNPSPANPS
jgi:hypothetical protein